MFNSKYFGVFLIHMTQFLGQSVVVEMWGRRAALTWWKRLYRDGPELKVIINSRPHLPSEPRLGGGANCCAKDLQLTDPHLPITARNKTNMGSFRMSPIGRPLGGLSPG